MQDLATESTTIALLNCNVVSVADGRMLRGKSILVRHGKIERIEDSPVYEPGVEAFNLRGLTVMPGLIDCHVHCVASDLNLRTNASLPNVFATLRAIPILESMLVRGFTTVRDAGGADWSLAEATRTGLVRGPRIFPSGRALSQTGGHGDFRPRNDQIEPCACSQKVGSIARVVDGVDQVRLAVREEIQKGATQIKIMASGGVASPNDPIHFLGFSEDEIRAAVEEAGNAGTYVMAHAYTSAAIARAVRLGVRTIEHGNLLDSESADAMARHGAFLVPTTITYDALSSEGESLGLPPESVAKIEAVRAAGRRALEIAARAGVVMGYGSDLLGASHKHQSDELRIRADVLGTVEALRSATVNAARILQRPDLGQVAPGCTADLLIVDGDPLADIGVLLNQGARIRAVLKEGQWIKRQAEAGEQENA